MPRLEIDVDEEVIEGLQWAASVTVFSVDELANLFLLTHLTTFSSDFLTQAANRMRKPRSHEEAQAEMDRLIEVKRRWRKAHGVVPTYPILIDREKGEWFCGCGDYEDFGDCMHMQLIKAFWKMATGEEALP